MLSSLLKNWLIGELGTHGEYQYQAIHWYSLLGVAVLMVIVFAIACAVSSNKDRSRRLLVAICVFQLAFEVVWRLIYFAVKKDPITVWLPAYPCNLGGILLPIFGLANCRRGKQMFYLFGFLGACITFAMPEGIFYTDAFTFLILKSILQHTGLLLIPMIEYVHGTFRPSLKDFGFMAMGCAIHIINGEFLTRLFGLTGDYLYFQSGLPFVIPGVPQCITLTVFALMVLAVLAFLCDVKGSVALLKSLGKKSAA